MENIEVAIRIRPINISELSSNDLEIWDSLSPQTIGISSEKNNELLNYRKIIPGQKTSFNFNYCYNQTTSNQQIYDRSIKRIALSSLQGINGTIFMYGQTGSGKTFTILGNKFQSLKQNQPSISEYPHKKPPIPPNTHDFLEKTPINNQNFRNLKTPNKINSASNIANIQIDLNSLMSESEKMEIESEKGLKREQYTNCFFENSDANPLKRQTECLFNHAEDENVEGILGLALKDLFSEMETQSDKKFFIRCSYLEIYTDIVYDLLNEQDKLLETLTIGEDLNKEFYVKGATDEIVTSVEDALFILKRGEANRHYATTIMNHSSSRSHTIFRLFLQCIPSKTQDIITESVLNFVDLAGSEKVSIHDHYFKKTRDKSAGHYNSSPLSASNSSYNSAFKDRVNESKHINKSLFFLTQVISLKSQGKPEIHIPFRNSPLTKILRSSLGGNSRTAIILCVNPCFSQYEQTLSTIRFGLNAKKIENNIRRNIITSNNDEVIKNLIHEYEKKINDMEKEKSEDQSRSQNLLNIIEKLQEQKNLIEERLLLVKKTESFNEKTRAKEVLKSQKLRNKIGDYIHFNHVGVLHVNSYSEIPKNELKFDSEGKFAMEALRILQEKEKMMVEKVEFSQRELYSFQDKYKTLLSKFNNLETKLTKKRKKIQEITKTSESASQENRLLNQFFELFENKSSEVLSRMSLDFLTKLEKQFQILLDGIKFEKYMRNFSVNLQNNLQNEKYKEILRVSKENLNDFFSLCRDSREKGSDINLKAEFLKEIGLKIVTLEEKDLANTSISSNFKDLLSQINIRNNNNSITDKNINSFQTYFEKENNNNKASSESCSEIESKPFEVEPFEAKLTELQKNFIEIKEKIKEKSFSYKEENHIYNAENQKTRDSVEKVKDNSPRRGFFSQNKENMNLSRRDFGKNQKKPEIIKTSTNKKGMPPFERHLEVLKSTNKN